MKKSDLKAGMEVTYRDGTIRIVGKDDDGLLDENSRRSHSLSDYNEDLTYIDSTGLDIVKVSFAWEHTEKEEEIVVTLDGIEYSELTLKSIIKKANSI